MMRAYSRQTILRTTYLQAMHKDAQFSTANLATNTPYRFQLIGNVGNVFKLTNGQTPFYRTLRGGFLVNGRYLYSNRLSLRIDHRIWSRAIAEKGP